MLICCIHFDLNRYTNNAHHILELHRYCAPCIKQDSAAETTGHHTGVSNSSPQGELMHIMIMPTLIVSEVSETVRLRAIPSAPRHSRLSDILAVQSSALGRREMSLFGVAWHPDGKYTYGR